jgi:hypothetical protein
MRIIHSANLQGGSLDFMYEILMHLLRNIIVTRADTAPVRTVAAFLLELILFQTLSASRSKQDKKFQFTVIATWPYLVVQSQCRFMSN